MARNYAAVPYEYLEEMDALTDEEFGRLIRALIEYSRSGTAISNDGNERFYAKRVMAQEDRFKESYEEQTAALSERGRAGAQARWGNAKNAEASQSIPKHTKASEAMQDDAKNGNTETETNTETDVIGVLDTNPPIVPPSAFDRFWAAYPKKVGKQAARKAFERIKGVPVEKMIQAVEYQRSTEQWRKNNGQFIPHPATWLNQGRWEDERESDQAGNSWNPFMEIAREEAQRSGQA